MQKFLLSLVLVFTFSFGAFGASSDDIYVRQDVLKERDRAFIAEIRAMNMDLRRDFEKEFAKIDKRFDEVDKRFIEVDKKFEQMRGDFNKQFEQMRGDYNKQFEQMRGDYNKQFEQVRGEIKELSTKVNTMDSNLNKRIDNLDSNLNKRIDNLDSNLNKRIDDLDSNLSKRIDDTHNFFYLIIFMLGIVIAIPFVQKWFDKQKSTTEQLQEKSIPQITPEYIKNLINETLAETLKANNLIVQRN